MSEIDENEFRDIPNFEGLYQINCLGVVKSLERYDEAGRLLKEKILKNQLDVGGYYCIKLLKDNTRKHSKIHKLLYIVFVGNYDKRYFEIDHIDRNRLNNKLENLRLVSCRNNHNNRTNQSLHGCCVCKFGNKYRTNICINNKLLHFGMFESQEDAHKKYLEIKSQIEEIEKVTHNYTFIRTKISKEYFIEFFPIL